ncbi:acyltransferase family protein [Streptomonospora salina]|uniref:Peptidoglycan/LPS O-acetylase OafA/YrhL n=1 Tax=Streptomonospora salina TaxID=104205 RepID=A0A841E3Q5_9ACTN|nr:SGNH hydrolase domain-containing protein [Streptomonospora salina]MBB5997666.1 peptidoglycan/LPS O-acetylase OafA/YrhL [Streptomonospora salina]
MPPSPPGSVAPPPSAPPEPPGAVQRTGGGSEGGSGFRPELEGLRAVAVVLVAAYHIWLGRVSGGVDVFLLLTGFLITGSLLRTVERRGRIGFTAFWARLVKRLFPAAAAALGGILVASLLFLPSAGWREVIAGVAASALYVENWHLALNSVDYLAQNSGAGPVQHFWSLSVQGQFYAVWPVLITAVAALARAAGQPLRRVAAAALTLVFAASLAYSVSVTASDQPWAYFDTGARLWELAMGGLLAIAVPHVRLPRLLRILLGWAGLAALVACGLLLQVSTMFPGYIALWPTLAAAAVILAGTTGSRAGADRLLNLRPMHYIGKHAYALYLWHWPVLVCYLEVTDRTQPSIIGGCLVLALSMALAAATRRITEDGVDALTRTRTGSGWSLAVGAAFIAPVLVAAGLWSGHIAHEQRERELAVQGPDYPGAAAPGGAAAGAAADGGVPVYPAPADAAEDIPVSYDQDCNQGTRESAVLTCTYGPESYDRTVALVGASHAAHWLPALREIAREKSWRIVNITKGSCLFTGAEQLRGGEVYHSCADWNAGVMAELAELDPDAVFTTATRTNLDARSGEVGETVFDGYVRRWRALEEMGIGVVAVRDTPRLDFEAPDCLSENPRAECVGSASPSMADTSPLAELEGVPGNVAFLDLTDKLCRGGRCPAVIGNVLVYWDRGHITASYMRTLAPILRDRIEAATDL